jgi:hypothetical protein
MLEDVNEAVDDTMLTTRASVNMSAFASVDM